AKLIRLSSGLPLSNASAAAASVTTPNITGTNGSRLRSSRRELRHENHEYVACNAPETVANPRRNQLVTGPSSASNKRMHKAAATTLAWSNTRLAADVATLPVGGWTDGDGCADAERRDGATLSPRGALSA